MSPKSIDCIFLALGLLLIWAAVSLHAEGGLLYRWREAFQDLARDFRGSKAMLIWVSFTVALGR